MATPRLASRHVPAAALLVMLVLAASTSLCMAQSNPIAGTGDCSEPSYINLDPANPRTAPTIITATVVAAGPGHARCVPSGSTPDQLKTLFPDGSSPSKAPDNSSTAAVELAADLRDVNSSTLVLLLDVACVNKGVLSCRDHPSDKAARRCIVGVEVPKPANPNDTCTATVGAHYLFMLGGSSAKECDGLYGLAFPSLKDSARPTLGFNSCVPYPAFPEPSVALGGEGWPARLAGACPGSKPQPVACTSDPCSNSTRQCAEGAAIACVTKACQGAIMVSSYLYPSDTCTPAYISLATGLPIGSCKATDRALARQQNRVNRANGAVPANRGSLRARPRLADPGQVLSQPVKGSTTPGALQQALSNLGAQQKADSQPAAGGRRR